MKSLLLLTTATALQQAWRIGEEVLGPRRVARALEVRRAGEAPARAERRACP